MKSISPDLCFFCTIYNRKHKDKILNCNLKKHYIYNYVNIFITFVFGLRRLFPRHV